MSRLQLPELTGQELTFREEEVLTSKTDLRGVITYANDAFCHVAGFEFPELEGQPHSLIRHPEMPRSVFNLMWETIQSGNEFFGYVCNRTKIGDHYWVLAHVVPDRDPETHEIMGFHSTRRCPTRAGIKVAKELYARLRETERKAPKAQQVEVGTKALNTILTEANMTYEEWIFSKINELEVA